jgi:hypothetical protein
MSAFEWALAKDMLIVAIVGALLFIATCALIWLPFFLWAHLRWVP